MKKVSIVLIFVLVLSLTSCDIFLPDVTTQEGCVLHIWSEAENSS